MAKIIENHGLKCPICNTNLIIYDATYIDEEGLKYSEIEWECPNGCLFDDDQIDEIDKQVEKTIVEKQGELIWIEE